MIELRCAECQKYMATLSDGSKFRNGMVVYCQPCNESNKRRLELAEISKSISPSFLEGFLGGNKYAG